MARRTRTLLAAAATGLALVGGFVAAPGASAVGGTITLTSTGGLSVTEPAATVNLGSKDVGVGTLTTTAFPISVSDTRAGLLLNTWTASVAVSNFTKTTPGGTDAQRIIPATGVIYTMGLPTSDPTNPAGSVFVPVAVAATVIAAPDVAIPVGAMTLATGPNSVSWSPTLTVAITNQVAGTYAGTVVHSVL